MKKILLATTVLAMTASVAAAEVAVSGSARMGVINNGGTNAATQFSSRVRIQFDGSGTTDGGLSFGASMRADQSGQGGTANGDSTVFVSGSFGKLTMGDVAGGAADNLVGQVSGAGYGASAVDGAQEVGFLGGNATAARYDYTSGALSVSVGLGQTTNPTNAADAGGQDAASIAVKYAAGAYTVALGYSSAKVDTNGATAGGVVDGTQVDLLGSATFGAATVKARLAQRDGVAAGAEEQASAISVDYAMGAATVTVFSANNTDFAGKDATGLGVSYDLGGGAAVKAGYADVNGTAAYDVGVTMSF